MIQKYIFKTVKNALLRFLFLKKHDLIDAVDRGE